MAQRTIRVATDPQALARMAAEHLVQSAEEAFALQGRFSLALAGGSTPRALYTLLADAPFKDRIDWSRVHIFFGDERCVPPDHPDSNYRMASESLLSKVPIPAEQVHRMRGEIAPEAAAAEYDARLRSFFRTIRPDLILLGLGDDSHTASLFPHTPALAPTDRLCVSNWVEKLKTHRITLTAPFINSAREVMFLVAGKSKAPAVKNVLEGMPDPNRLPAQMIDPADGRLLWFMDVAAAEMEDQA